jgi:tetratricopeptide (TPR) repeat protein
MNTRHIVTLIAICLAVAAILMLGRARRGISPPNQSVAIRESAPTETIGPFYVGISSLDVGENERAGQLFDDLSKKMPKEPAIWANLGLARLRLGDLPGAEQALDAAANLVPTNDDVVLLQAIVDENQGRFPEAVERLRKLAHPNVAVLYRLEELLARTGSAGNPREQLEIFDHIQRLQPNNLVAAFGRARLLAQAQDQPLLSEAIKGLDTFRQNWSAPAIQEFDSAKTAVTAGDFRSAATHLTFLQNLSKATPAYQAALSALGITGGAIGEPVRALLQYSQPEVAVSPADELLKFVLVPDASVSKLPEIYLALSLSTNRGPSVLSVTDGKLRIPDQADIPVSGPPSPLGRSSVCAADLNGDGLQDLALINGGGLKLWIQGQDGKFTAYHPAENLRRSFESPGHGVWAIDYDADGDLDLVVGRDGAAPWVLRNNGDGGFTAVDALSSFPEVREVCWADFDGDGNGDLALLDVAGRVLVSWNNRAGSFAVPQPVSESPAVALTFGDVIGNGEMGLIVLERNGAIKDFSFDREKRTWSSRELARWADPPDLADAFNRQRAGISVADLDNNGAVDIVASAGTTSAIWLNGGRGKFQRLADAPPLFVTSIADMDNDGFLDLVGLTDTGAAVAHARGTKSYHWQSIQTRTLANLADGRINSLGIGGRIEIRAGPLLEEMPITSSRTHFGLGAHDQVGVARIVWPNGVAQAEFDLKPNQEVTAVQRLKGSCPWVFARSGGAFHFVKDFIWRSPLGMRINSQDTAGVDQTEDWILIPGKAMTADNGAYEIRITAELWETHFFDHVALKVVDHPESIAAVVDERFVPTRQPKLEVIATTLPRPFAYVRDQLGGDVSKTVAASDGDYVTNFPLGRFQGIAQDHWVEFQLPDDAPSEKPLALIGEGWIYPTDSSLNVAISQGTNISPRDLVIEDYDPKFGWRVASGDLGFPAGKNKTVVIPLPRESLQAGRRRFRLRTNLEIYWDRLGWAVTLLNADLKSMPAEMLTAELHYRGFSELPAPDRREPDIPQYDRLAGAGPRWQDLEGYYTRYGDVRELLQQTDDRYVIMNAGDEIVLRFAAPPSPPAGWTRDFVLIGDGWVKDGDFNTANSRTVQPLPAHSMRQYGGTDQPLEADPVFQRNTEDWRRFHTRYVAPYAFERGLMNGLSAPDGISP